VESNTALQEEEHMVNTDLVLRLPSANELDPRFPLLSGEMIGRIRAYGEELLVPAGTRLFSVGDRLSGMFVILRGEIKVYAVDSDGNPKLVAHHRESEFTNELDLISSRHTLVDGITETDCILVHVPRDGFRRLIDSEGDIANLIMQAAVWRRIALVEGLVSGVTLLGERGNNRTNQLQDFLTRNNYPFRLVETFDQQPSEWDCHDPTTPSCSLPAVILPDGRRLDRPNLSLLADELGLMEDLDPETVFDVVVVGAGPAGLAAGVYAASEGLSTLLIESYAPGGQAGTSSRIENYLGFPTGGNRSRTREPGSGPSAKIWGPLCYFTGSALRGPRCRRNALHGTL
jgi:thioredoxin reductase (NADPH)